MGAFVVARIVALAAAMSLHAQTRFGTKGGETRFGSRCPANVNRLSCSEAPRAGGTNGSPLAAIKLKQREAICKRDDVVRLGTREAARPPGAANGPLTASGSS